MAHLSRIELDKSWPSRNIGHFSKWHLKNSRVEYRNARDSHVPYGAI